MAKLKKHGKGIVLMHDFQHATGEAAMDLLNDLKAGGYKVVFMKPKFPVTTIASYDEAILKQMRGPGERQPPDLERRAHDQRVTRSSASAPGPWPLAAAQPVAGQLCEHFQFARSRACSSA